MCDDHGKDHHHFHPPFPPHFRHHKKGKILKLTSNIVESYLATFDSPPSLDELQNIIKTVFGTLKELKGQCCKDKKEEK